MFARLSAKAMLVAAAAAMVFFGIGLLGMALATAAGGQVRLAGRLRHGRRDPVAAAAAVGPHSFAPRRRGPSKDGENDFMNSLFATLARETPWAAVVGAGLVGIANLFLNRHKNKK